MKEEEIKKLANDFVVDLEKQIDEFIPDIMKIVTAVTMEYLEKCPDEDKEKFGKVVSGVFDEMCERRMKNL